MLLKVTDDATALELDVALAERARQETWRDAFDIEGEKDFFSIALRLLMDMVKR